MRAWARHPPVRLFSLQRGLAALVRPRQAHRIFICCTHKGCSCPRKHDFTFCFCPSVCSSMFWYSVSNDIPKINNPGRLEDTPGSLTWFSNTLRISKLSTTDYYKRHDTQRHRLVNISVLENRQIIKSLSANKATWSTNCRPIEL